MDVHIVNLLESEIEKIERDNWKSTLIGEFSHYIFTIGQNLFTINSVWYGVWWHSMCGLGDNVICSYGNSVNDNYLLSV